MPIPIRRYWNLLVNYLARQKARVALLAVLLLGLTGLQLLRPQIIKRFIDAVRAGTPVEALLAINWVRRALGQLFLRAPVRAGRHPRPKAAEESQKLAADK